MTDVQAVLFDLGNVLVRVNVDMFWRSLNFANPEEIAPYAGELKSWAMRYEAGEFATAEFMEGMQRIFGGRFRTEQLHDAFERIIGEPFEGMEQLVGRVSQRHRTALVSNTNEIHHLGSIRLVPALRYLPKHYVSYQLHVMKPAAGFYQAIVRDQQLPPDALVFIDDLEENVKAAVKAGMQGIRFEGVAALEKRLKEVNILE